MLYCALQSGKVAYRSALASQLGPRGAKATLTEQPLRFGMKPLHQAGKSRVLAERDSCIQRELGRRTGSGRLPPLAGLRRPSRGKPQGSSEDCALQRRPPTMSLGAELTAPGARDL